MTLANITATPSNIRRAGSIIFGLFLLGALAANPAAAEPMKCSGQEKACTSACAKTARTKLSSCLTACGVSMSYCSRTGCWVYGGKQFCGLLKQ